jgi:hypothetical protein
MDIGQTWNTVTMKTEGPGVPPQRVDYLFRVEGAEPIVAANGVTYPTFRIHRTDNDTADGSTKEMILWFSPYVGMVKRQILEFHLDLKSATLK